jgi:hypothetical protein
VGLCFLHVQFYHGSLVASQVNQVKIALNVIPGQSQAQEQRAIGGIFFFLSCHRQLALTPCHLITLSALASTLGGIVTPICFAVFRLMMN